MGLAGKVVERGGVDNDDGFEGVVGGIIVEVLVGGGRNREDKGMSMMFSSHWSAMMSSLYY